MNSIIKGFDPVILPLLWRCCIATSHEEFPFHSQMVLIPGFSRDGRKNKTGFYTFIKHPHPRHMVWLG
jgi:hypothetical protein